MSVTVRAPAKVNLVLGVGRPAEDGFHPLDTVYQAISLYDDVRVSAAEEWSVTVSPIGEVDVAQVPLDGSNMAIRAGQALAGHHGRDLAAAIEIRKGIPVAGGLAGGSADAAAALVALDRLWDLYTDDDTLLAIAGSLGSDVPFALIGGTAHGLGHGELVTPLPDRGSWWWVVVPSTHGLSTPVVYRELDRLDPDRAADAHLGASVDAIAAVAEGDPDALSAAMRNDLEAAAISLRPELGEQLSAVAAHSGGRAMLSGSGPTVVAAASTQEQATHARGALVAAGLPVVQVATGPVAGAHVVEYD